MKSEFKMIGFSIERDINNKKVVVPVAIKKSFNLDFLKRCYNTYLIKNFNDNIKANKIKFISFFERKRPGKNPNRNPNIKYNNYAYTKYEWIELPKLEIKM